MAREDDETPKTVQGIALRFPQIDDSDLRTLLRLLGGSIRKALSRKFLEFLDENDLDDILATAVYKLWVHRHVYDASKGPLQAWFYVIARNAAFDLLRDRVRHRSIECSTRSVDLVASPPRDLYDARRDRRAEALTDILNSLPERDRLLVLAYAREGGNEGWAAEFGRRFGLKGVTVRVRRLRLMQRIRKQMSERGLAPLPNRGVRS